MQSNGVGACPEKPPLLTEGKGNEGKLCRIDPFTNIYVSSWNDKVNYKPKD